MPESPHPEGWQVPQRTPAIAAAATLALILVLLLIAGWTYKRTIAAQRHAPVSTFPAPGVETFVHDGQADPPRPRATQRPDPAIEAAKHAIVSQGIQGWPK